jgi:Caspase domain/Domain of unknown function (DUF4384)
MNRRDFLQSIALTLATLGISQLDLQRRVLQYGQVLAAGTRRKLALLVGISDYPGRDVRDLKTQGLWYRLPGAITDVELQRELLIHRFGFHTDDILVLRNEEAKRENILTAFKTHLLQGIQSDRDIAIFHYSGHGSNVIDPNKVFQDGLNGTIVPYDADLPPGYPQQGGAVNDITAGTIFLMREAIARKTKNATFILDSCYSGGGVRGNLILRSRPGQVELSAPQTTQLVLNQSETAAQQRWLKELGWSEPEWLDRRKTAKVNGVAIFAAQRDQAAADVTFAENIHAGIFTYALTRQLWQQTSHEGMGKVIVAVAAKTEQFLKTSEHTRLQTPGIEVQKGSQDQPMYFSPLQKAAAEAVITEVNGKAVKLLLTGTEPEVLEALGKGAVLTLVDEQGRSQGSVQVESRDRLTATGTLQTNANFPVAPGTMLQEQVRAVPTDLQLRIGLDPSLGAAVKVAAVALRSLLRIAAVPLSPQSERSAVHYSLGRMTPAYRQVLMQRLPPGLTTALPQQTLTALPEVNSVGLWSVGFEPIPGSFGAANEPLPEAIQRLQTKFKLLLAARLLKMTLNTSSSRLNVVAQMQVADSQALLAETFTVRGSQPATPGKLRTINAGAGRLAQVAIGKPVQIWVENQEPQQDLHIGVLVFSPDGDIDILFPLTEGKNAALVAAGQTLKIPSPEQIRRGIPLSFQAPLGMVEVLVVASTAPIAKALKPLQALIAEQRKSERSASQVAEQAEGAIASLLDDLASGTRGSSPSAAMRHFDVQQLAALSITVEIVAG